MYKCVIYKATNLVNGKSYIGKTAKWPHRKSEHLKANDDLLFHKAIRKYGSDSFSWEILYSLSTDSKELADAWSNSMEIACIKNYKTFGELGYNLTAGGEGGDTWSSRPSRKHSEETKLKMSIACSGELNHNYGLHPTEETRQKLSQSHTGEKNSMYGKHFSEESKMKMSAVAKGRKPSEAAVEATKKQYRWLTPDGSVVMMNKSNAHRYHPDWVCIDEPNA